MSQENRVTGPPGLLQPGPAANGNVPLGWPYRGIWLLIGCTELAEGIAKLTRPAWLSGFLRVAIGIAVLSVATVFWSHTGARIRPVSERQKRNAAWTYAHPGVLVIALGLSFGLLAGALQGLSEGGWLISMAEWLPGGVVFGLLAVRELRRRTVLGPE